METSDMIPNPIIRLESGHGDGLGLSLMSTLYYKSLTFWPLIKKTKSVHRYQGSYWAPGSSTSDLISKDVKDTLLILDITDLKTVLGTDSSLVIRHVDRGKARDNFSKEIHVIRTGGIRRRREREETKGCPITNVPS